MTTERAAALDLRGRVALVTGGSRGIGAATARLFKAAGARVAITYRTRRADAEAVGADAVYQADLGSPSANEDVVAAAVRDLGRLDCFVVNHGIWPPADVPVGTMTDARWRETLRVNLDGVFYGCRAAVGVMDEGRIVIVTSTAGQRGEASHADYAASKGALIAFVKSLAIEVAPHITVNSVAPGWVDTEMAADSYAGGGRARITAGIPLGRVASAEDIAGPIVFLCSDLARHVTGEILNVNGGSVLCG